MPLGQPGIARIEAARDGRLPRPSNGTYRLKAWMSPGWSAGIGAPAVAWTASESHSHSSCLPDSVNVSLTAC
jgi:hypothetical protein